MEVRAQAKPGPHMEIIELRGAGRPGPRSGHAGRPTALQENAKRRRAKLGVRVGLGR